MAVFVVDGEEVMRERTVGESMGGGLTILSWCGFCMAL